MFTPEQAEELKKLIDKNTEPVSSWELDVKKEYIDQAIKGIWGAFSWMDSKEGADYWCAVHNKLLEYRKLVDD